LERGAECVSDEHDPAWHTMMRSWLAEFEGIDYRPVPPQPIPEQNLSGASDPSLYLSEDPSFKRYGFPNYASQIDSFRDEHFDVVLVDGRSRPACIKHAAPEVKIGGILILDDADRAYYLSKTKKYLDGYERKEFTAAVPLIKVFQPTKSTFE
jgi:hypothetical protein